LKENFNDFIFEEAWVPPDFHVAIRNHCKARLPGRSNDEGRASKVWMGKADKTTAFILVTSSFANAEKTKGMFHSEL
jgi:hypothetical protein